MRFLIAALVAVPLGSGVSRCLGADDLPTLVDYLKSDHLPAQILACEELANRGPAAADALPALIDVLRDGPIEAREAAMHAVRAIGAEAASAVPPLIVLLRDRHYWVRDEAAEALIAIGPAALPQVIRAMKSDSPRARAAATRVIGNMVSESHLILPALTEALKDPDARVRATSAAALGGYGSEAVAALAAAASEKDPCVAVAIAEALERLHAGPSVAVAALMRLLDQPEAKLAAVRGLQQYGVLAKRAIPALVNAYPAGVDNVYAELDDAVIKALEHIGPPHIDDLPAFDELVRNESADVRRLAARQLGMMGDVGAARDRATKALKPPLSDSSAVVRMEAARSLWSLQHDAAPVLGVLESAADGDEYDAIRGVSETLAEIGKPAVPVLIRLLENENEKVRWWSAEALGQIGGEAADALPSLSKALLDEDSGVRDAISRAIGQLGPAGAPAVPALVTAAKERRLDAGQLAIAVQSIGTAARQAMPILVRGLAEGDESARSRIIDAICSLGVEDEAIVDIVTDAIERHRVRRAWSIDAFAKLKGKAAAKAIPILTESLKAPDDYLREVAARTLGQMGASANIAVPLIREAMADKQFPVRLQAGLALWRLTGETEPMQMALSSAFHGEIADSDYNTWYRRRETLEAVHEMGPAAAPLLPTMLASMKDSPDDLTIAFIEALASLGEAGNDAVPALIEISKNTDWEIRKASIDAVKQIRDQHEGNRK